MKPMSAFGSSSCAAWTKPSPARSTGTTTGCDVSARPSVSVSGVVTRTACVGRPRVASAISSDADPLELLAEQGVRVSAVADPVERVGDQRMVDEVDGDGHGRECCQDSAQSRRCARHVPVA